MELQVSELKDRMKGLQTACNEHQQQAAVLETQLREEVARSAPLHGMHLDRLTLSQLDSLARLHERGLKHTKALQVCLFPFLEFWCTFNPWTRFFQMEHTGAL